jgi:proteasome accessory factor C
MPEPPAPRLARRLRRILVLLPYAIKHPGVSVDELARKFSVPRRELMDDLSLLFVCGLPGYGPGDLIDVSVDEDHVYVRMAEYFAAPLRLTPVEALSLYAGGAAMAAMPEMEEADALRRGLAKLARALGASGGAGATPIDVRFESGPDHHVATIRTALAESRRVRLEYFSASSGELTEREVDPWALYAALGRWYLIGWDHLKSDERMFRTDRIKSIESLPEPAPVPDDFDVSSYKDAFKARADQPLASFELSPRAARWFEEYYPVTEARDLADGWRATGLAYSSEEWLARLLLSLGEDVRAVRPAVVMARVRALAAEILDVYQTA